jgi:uncharacterized protein
MDIINLLIILGVGVLAGFINAVAGGGSLLTMPVLIFMGLPPAVANGTNRVAIFIQNIFGVAGYKSKGISAFPYSLWLGISALLGAIIGAKIAVEISGDLFEKILAVVMVGVIVITVFGSPGSKGDMAEKMSKAQRTLAIIVFFFIGIYGGFIQAGVGFIILAALTLINRFTLVKANSAKVFVILVYTASALVVFIIEDKIEWLPGLILAVGNSAGAWFGSRWAVDKGEKWIKIILIIAVTGMAIKLWFG